MTVSELIWHVLPLAFPCHSQARLLSSCWRLLMIHASQHLLLTPGCRPTAQFCSSGSMQHQLYAKPRVEPATLRDGPVCRRGGAIVACAHCSSGLLLDQFLRLLFFLHQCAAALSAVVTAIAVAAVIHAPRCGTEAWHSASAPALHAAAPPPQSLLANWLGAVLPERQAERSCVGAGQPWQRQP